MSLPRRSPASATTPIVLVDAVSREYRMGAATVHALRAVSLEVPTGQLIVVQGRSGSGKTTLLNLIGGLDDPTSGKILLDGRDLATLKDRERTELRRRRIGFIFQAFGLVPILSAAENVEIPMRLVRSPVDEREARVAMLLELVGLGERARHRPHELSGGEQQRVAIARSLANSPELLIADEPTGQLDSQTGRTIMTLLRSIVRSEGVTAIVATHDPLLVDLADRIIQLSDGRVVEDARQGPPVLPAAMAQSAPMVSPQGSAIDASSYRRPPISASEPENPAPPPRSPYARPVPSGPAPPTPAAPPRGDAEPDDEAPIRPPFSPPPR
jgi:putative ABC transport system ATP-binding protein